jgi:hypothetical protein
MITRRMKAFIIGHSLYQFVIIEWLLYYGDFAFDIESGRGRFHGSDQVFTQHYTMIFNSFVLMQIFNEFNARKLYGERNVFKGVLANPIFVGIIVLTFGLQLFITQVSGPVFKLVSGGLNGEQWAFCICVGAFSIVWQQVINVVYECIVKFTGDEPEMGSAAPTTQTTRAEKLEGKRSGGIDSGTAGVMQLSARGGLSTEMTRKSKAQLEKKVSTLSIERTKRPAIL